MPSDSWRDRLRRLVGLVILLVVVGGFALSFGGTVHEKRTILAWLGYPEYNTPAFLLGMAGLLAAVVYGYYVTDRED